ncbi:uncharacterized protein LOC119637355 [Glossina fuscipes]|uniref:Uncharacterized protein LOC119637355 n=1 Tax=Glossina fuscipes TaxID=7396 RepID=A0A9C5Z4A3_9MUSC|nr:uncharacterized protein LOC119637355 [Glossina fuscipes]
MLLFVDHIYAKEGHFVATQRFTTLTLLIQSTKLTIFTSVFDVNDMKLCVQSEKVEIRHMEQNTRKSTEEAINLSTTSRNKTKINGILQNFSTATIPSPTIAGESHLEEAPTTSNSKAIVDAILEDFSTASFTSSRSTPEKHLKEIPKRCYSRKFRKRIQEKSVDAEVNTAPVDDFSSCSSIGDNDDKFRIPANVTKLIKEILRLRARSVEHIRFKGFKGYPDRRK